MQADRLEAIYKQTVALAAAYERDFSHAETGDRMLPEKDKPHETKATWLAGSPDRERNN